MPNDPAADARQQRLVGANLVRILTLLLDATRRAWVAFKPRSGEAVPRPGSGVDQFTQFVREVIASEAAELIRLQGLVPITVFRRGSVDGRPAEMGSAQEWVVGARRWTDFPPNARPRVAAADAQTALFFDALFGNSDRRKENILFLDRGDGTYRPILIDNGLILPRRSPHDFVFPQILSQGPLDPGVGALVKSVDARKLTELVRTRGIERDAAESVLYRLFRIQDDPVLLATQEVKQGEGIWKVVMNPTDGLSRSRIDDANRILDAVYGPAPKGP